MSTKTWMHSAATAGALVLSLGLLTACAPSVNPTPSPTGSQSASPTESPTPTQTPTPTPTPSFTPGVDIIYIDSPLPGETVTKTTLTVLGRASVFEGQFQFKLYRNGKLFQSGSIGASAGSPDLGEWHYDLADLTVGDYKFTAYDTSEKDGSTILKTSVEFLVRLND